MNLIHWIILCITIHQHRRTDAQDASQDDPCLSREVVMDEEAHIITSNGYPDRYETNTECRWEIDTRRQYNENRVISLTFVDVNLASTTDPQDSYIGIYSSLNQSAVSELAEIRGKTQLKTMDYFIPLLLIVFKTGRHQDGTGFKLIYQMRNVSSCHEHLTAEGHEKTLTSRNYPSAYPSFQRCTYLIKARGKHMKVRLKVLESHIGDYCRGDYILVYDGPTEEGPMVGKWCGNYPRTYKSLRGSLFLVFVSKDNSQRRRKGIKAKYQEEMCGETLDARNQTQLIFPENFDPYRGELRCEWKIYSLGKVLVYLSDIGVSCPSSRIIIDNGSGETQTFCNADDQMYLSTGNKMVVSLISDGLSPLPVSFKMKYWSTETSACKGEKEYLMANNYQHKLESPGYPFRYPDHVSCVWQIQSETTWHKVRVTVDLIDLEPSDCSDHISFFHGPVFTYNRPDMILCGTNMRTFESKNNFATVHFYTDEHMGRKGFVLYYQSFSDSPGGNPVGVSTSSFPNGPVIGGIVGAVIIIIIVTVFCIFLIRRQQSASRQNQTTYPRSYAPDSSSPFLVTNTTSAPSAPSPPLDTGAPPPTYQELNPIPIPAVHPTAPALPPPSYEDAISKGMIQDTSETGF